MTAEEEEKEEENGEIHDSQRRDRNYFRVAVIEIIVIAVLNIPFAIRASYGYGWWPGDEPESCITPSCSLTSENQGHEIGLYEGRGKAVAGKVPLRVAVVEDATGDRHNGDSTYRIRYLLVDPDAMEFGSDTCQWGDDYVSITVTGNSNEPFTTRFYWSDYSFGSMTPFGYMNDL